MKAAIKQKIADFSTDIKHAKPWNSLHGHFKPKLAKF